MHTNRVKLTSLYTNRILERTTVASTSVFWKIWTIQIPYLNVNQLASMLVIVATFCTITRAKLASCTLKNQFKELVILSTGHPNQISIHVLWMGKFHGQHKQLSLQDNLPPLISQLQMYRQQLQCQVNLSLLVLQNFKIHFYILSQI